MGLIVNIGGRGTEPYNKYHNVVFSIHREKDCTPVRLEFYDDGTYELFTEYKTCRAFESCISRLEYVKSIKGTYDFDLTKILDESINVTAYDGDNKDVEYTIFAASLGTTLDEKYRHDYVILKGKTNKPLEELLNKIDVDLNDCAIPDYNKSKDRTYSYEKYEDKNVIDSFAISENLLTDDFKTLVNNSDAVVKGKVVSVDFIPLQGNAWRKIIFHVDDTIIGDVKPDTDIEVYMLGGYITLEDHIKYNDDAFRFKNVKDVKNTVIKETVDDELEFIKEDETLILCIVEPTNVSLFPKGTYQRTGASGMLKLKDGKYTQLYGEVEEKYSIDSNKVNDIKKLVSKKSSN